MNDYPTEEELEKISKWSYEDYHGLMDYVRNLWAFGAWGFDKDGENYHVSTGGWSGNENVIYALKQNQMFWALFWQQSTRGGHYIFAPMTLETIEKLNKPER